MCEKTEKIKLVNFRMPESLARQFKAKAALEGESMADALNRLVLEYVGKERQAN
jgi:hypothetical protein